MLLQTISIALNHLLLVAQPLSLLENFRKLCARLVELGIGFRQFVVPLREALRFCFFTSYVCALTF